MDDNVLRPDDELSDDELSEDTEFATVADGETVEAAKKKALEQLRKVVPLVQEHEIEFVVLDEGGHGGFLGMGKSHPRVEARILPGTGALDPDAPPMDEAIECLLEFVTTVVEGMGLDAVVDVSVAGEAVVADVAGEDLGILIGRHGQTLDAVQYLASIVVNGHSRSRRPVIVDAEGYRGRREAVLSGVADRAAQKAERTRSPVDLQPMSAAERKIVHMRLKDHPRVETHSEGDEPQRLVVVSPKSR
jgi:spoIIIJ-associated protein